MHFFNQQPKFWKYVDCGYETWCLYCMSRHGVREDESMYMFWCSSVGEFDSVISEFGKREAFKSATR